MGMFSLHDDESMAQLNSQVQSLKDLREENKLISDMLYQVLDRIETAFTDCRSSDD